MGVPIRKTRHLPPLPPPRAATAACRRGHRHGVHRLVLSDYDYRFCLRITTKKPFAQQDLNNTNPCAPPVVVLWGGRPPRTSRAPESVRHTARRPA